MSTMLRASAYHRRAYIRSGKTNLGRKMCAIRMIAADRHHRHPQFALRDELFGVGRQTHTSLVGDDDSVVFNERIGERCPHIASVRVDGITTSRKT
jgi:hypothetical protein